MPNVEVIPDEQNMKVAKAQIEAKIQSRVDANKAARDCLAVFEN